MTEFTERYSQYCNEDLLKILKNPDKYQTIAVETAREIISKRNLTDLQFKIAEQNITNNFERNSTKKDRFKNVFPDDLLSAVYIAFILYSTFVVFVQWIMGAVTIVIFEELLLVLFLILVLPIKRSSLLSKMPKQYVIYFILFLFLNLAFIIYSYIFHRQYVVTRIYPYHVLMQIAEIHCLFILYFIYNFRKREYINHLSSVVSYITVLLLISANIYIKYTTQIIHFTG